jgi:hypothetical protein
VSSSDWNALLLHDEVRAIDGAARRVGRRWDRRGDHLLPEAEPQPRPTAHEGARQILAAPEIIEFRGKRMIDDHQRHARRLDQMRKQPLPRRHRARGDGIHAGIGDQFGWHFTPSLHAIMNARSASRKRTATT